MIYKSEVNPGFSGCTKIEKHPRVFYFEGEVCPVCAAMEEAARQVAQLNARIVALEKIIEEADLRPDC